MNNARTHLYLRSQYDFIKLDEPKHFAALVLPLIGQADHELFVKRPVDPQNVIDMFRSDIATKWNSDQKPSIIMGSEEIDGILAENLDGDEILDKIFSILPPNPRSVMDVVVAYRSPKVEHLLSLWREVGVQLWNQTFAEFIFNPEAYAHIHTIESLPLVEKFLSKGLRVVLVDIRGLKMHKVETTQLLGCDLMRESCNADGVPDFVEKALEELPLLGKRLKESVNVRSDGVMDLDEGSVAEIEKAMLKYDCGFADSLIGHSNLSILYDAHFVSNMERCKPRSKKMERRDLWNAIKMAANRERAIEDRKRR